MSYTYATSTSAGNASGNALSVNKPASTANGDLLIGFFYWEGDSQTITLPSGWAMLRTYDRDTVTSPDFCVFSCYKFASSEGASWSWTPSVNSQWRIGVVARYTPPGSGTSIPLDVSSGNVGLSSGSVNEKALSVTTNHATETVLATVANFEGTTLAYVSGGVSSNARVQLGGCGIWDGTKTTAAATTDLIWGADTVHYVANQIALLDNTATVLTFSGSGSLTDSGTLTKLHSEALAGALTDSGILAKIHNEPLSGALSDSGVISKVTNKSLAGALTDGGTLTSHVIRALSLVGTLSDSGALAQVFNKPLSGALTDSGTLVRLNNKVLSGSLSDSRQLTDLLSKLLIGTLSDSGTLAQKHSLLFSGVLNDSGALAKVGNKALSGALSDSGVYKQVVKIGLTGSLSDAGTLKLLVELLLSGTLTPEGAVSIVNGHKLTLLGSVTPTSHLAKLSTLHGFAGTLSSSGIQLNVQTIIRLGTLSSSATLSSSINHGAILSVSLNGVMASSATLKLLPSKRIAGTISPSARVGMVVTYPLIGSLTSSGHLANARVVQFVGSLLSSGTEKVLIAVRLLGSVNYRKNWQHLVQVEYNATLRFHGELFFNRQGEYMALATDGSVVWIENTNTSGVLIPIPTGGAYHAQPNGDVVWLESNSVPATESSPIPVGGRFISTPSGGIIWIEG